MLTLRYMTPADIPTIVDIDRASFPNPWTERSYNFELRENQASHMVVLENGEADDPILGYGGLWLFEDESHISTIAVREDQRGKGYGEIVLAGMINRTLELGATYTVLEVRVSNAPAIKLYHKYEFEIVHRRKRYYNNGEDAYMMYLNPMNDAYRLRFDERFRAVQQRLPFNDLLSAGKPSY
ncbi:MAG: ribosomal protein S18-alanine N-acetyltransferase [Anaerolineae bacterium]